MNEEQQGTQTIAGRYARIGGFTHGFDYMRILLAVAVVLQHSYLSSYGGAAAGDMWHSWVRSLTGPILPMFFGLSGFLVAGSLKKNPTVTSFMTLRALRIVPALAVEVLLSAVVLGVLFTKLPLGEYFASWNFWGYFQNVFGRIRYVLPGVFTDLPFPDIVNVSLWTVPYELECYVILMAGYLVGLTRQRAWFAIVTLVAIAIGTVAALQTFELAAARMAPLPRSLIVSFLVGVAFNLYADRVVLSWKLALAALLLLITCTLSYQWIYIATIPAVYLVVYLGMTHPPKRSILFSGDYSYGLYLFAFPIQQSYTALFPDARHWLLNAGFALTLGFAYAAFSWWCVEKPVLSRKGAAVRHAEAARDRILRRLRRRPRGPAVPVGSRVG